MEAKANEIDNASRDSKKTLKDTTSPSSHGQQVHKTHLVGAQTEREHVQNSKLPVKNTEKNPLPPVGIPAQKIENKGSLGQKVSLENMTEGKAVKKEEIKLAENSQPKLEKKQNIVNFRQEVKNALRDTAIPLSFEQPKEPQTVTVEQAKQSKRDGNLQTVKLVETTPIALVSHRQEKPLPLPESKPIFIKLQTLPPEGKSDKKRAYNKIFVDSLPLRPVEIRRIIDVKQDVKKTIRKITIPSPRNEQQMPLVAVIEQAKRDRVSITKTMRTSSESGTAEIKLHVREHSLPPFMNNDTLETFLLTRMEIKKETSMINLDKTKTLVEHSSPKVEVARKKVTLKQQGITKEAKMDGIPSREQPPIFPHSKAELTKNRQKDKTPKTLRPSSEKIKLLPDRWAIHIDKNINTYLLKKTQKLSRKREPEAVFRKETTMKVTEPFFPRTEEKKLLNIKDLIPNQNTVKTFAESVKSHFLSAEKPLIRAVKEIILIKTSQKIIKERLVKPFLHETPPRKRTTTESKSSKDLKIEHQSPITLGRKKRQIENHLQSIKKRKTKELVSKEGKPMIEKYVKSEQLMPKKARKEDLQKINKLKSIKIVDQVATKMPEKIREFKNATEKNKKISNVKKANIENGEKKSSKMFIAPLSTIKELAVNLTAYIKKSELVQNKNRKITRRQKGQKNFISAVSEPRTKRVKESTDNLRNSKLVIPKIMHETHKNGELPKRKIKEGLHALKKQVEKNKVTQKTMRNKNQHEKTSQKIKTIIKEQQRQIKEKAQEIVFTVSDELLTLIETQKIILEEKAKTSKSRKKDIKNEGKRIKQYVKIIASNKEILFDADVLKKILRKEKKRKEKEKDKLFFIEEQAPEEVKRDVKHHKNMNAFFKLLLFNTILFLLEEIENHDYEQVRSNGVAII